VTGGAAISARRCDCVLHYVQVARDIATALYWTGLDPFTGKEVYGRRDRRHDRGPSCHLLKTHHEWPLRVMIHLGQALPAPGR
jgi:hypothetical protein